MIGGTHAPSRECAVLPNSVTAAARLAAGLVLALVFGLLSAVPADAKTHAWITVTSGPEIEARPIASPDGRYVLVDTRSADQQGPWHLVLWSVDGVPLWDMTEISYYLTPAWSPDSSRFIVYATMNGVRGLYAVDVVNGRIRQLLAAGGFISDYSWSPDGQRIAVALTNYTPSLTGSLVEITADGSSPVTMATAPGYVEDVAWSPTGQDIAYSLAPTGFDPAQSLQVMHADGSQDRTLVGGAGSRISVGRGYLQWSLDGSRIAFVMSPDPAAAFDAFVIETSTGRLTNLTARTAASNSILSGPAWSPDGKQLLLSYSDNSDYDIYPIATVRPDGSHWTRSAATGEDPVWLNGKQLAIVFCSWTDPLNVNYNIYELVKP
jgi:Tol biopolymer transport system component